jgi:predicted GIY-YIG superfamily endonuclease
MHFREKSYYVYIMINRSKTLYTGITSNPPKRVCHPERRVRFAAQDGIQRGIYAFRPPKKRAAYAALYHKTTTFTSPRSTPPGTLPAPASGDRS